MSGAERLREIAAGPGVERVRVAGRYRTRVREPGPMTEAEAAVTNERLPYDFSVSATGRTSNELYDVWHVGVQLIVDWQKLPELFRHFQQVNFMTVLDVKIKGVDEYEALEKGMIFGAADAVEVDLLIESIWLREWTQGPDAAQDTREFGDQTITNTWAVGRLTGILGSPVLGEYERQEHPFH